jgi:hypothetical protein
MQVETNTVVLRAGWVAISILVMVGLAYILLFT